MPSLCFTVDLDPDVNCPIPGQVGAGSLDRGDGPRPRFSSAERGLGLLLELLDELLVPATFFAEGRTLEHMRDQVSTMSRHEVGAHGMEHEDLEHLCPDVGRRIIARVRETVEDVTGHAPVSFRAPYMSVPCWMDDVLVECGFRCDSSRYAEPRDCLPRTVRPGLTEVPVVRSHRDGRPSYGYLWPMHEGRRGPDSFSVLDEELPQDGALVIADHCWHIVESFEGGLRDDAGVSDSLDNVRRVLEHFLDEGYRPMTVSSAASL